MGQFAKLLHVGFLAHQGFGGFRAHDAFVKRAGDAAVGLAHGAPALEDLLLKIKADNGQRRQHHHHGQTQLPVDGQHRDRAHHQHHYAPEQIQQAPADGFGQALDIAGHAAHQIADGHAVIIGKGQFLQLMEGLLADVVAYAHLDYAAQIQEGVNGGDLHNHQHCIQEDKARHGVAGKQGGRRADHAVHQPSHGARGGLRTRAGNQIVDRVAGQQRKGHVAQGADGHRQGQCSQVRIILPGVMENFAPQGQVKFLRIVFFLRLLHGFSSPPGRCGGQIPPPARSGC